MNPDARDSKVSLETIKKIEKLNLTLKERIFIIQTWMKSHNIEQTEKPKRGQKREPNMPWAMNSYTECFNKPPPEEKAWLLLVNAFEEIGSVRVPADDIHKEQCDECTCDKCTSQKSKDAARIAKKMKKTHT